MRDLLESLVTLPMPLVGLLVLGILLWRRRGLSFFLIAMATILFIALSMPSVAGWIEAGLRTGAPAYHPDRRPKPDWVLVPTAGVFTDRTRRLWPAPESVRRIVAGAELARSAGLPLVVIGGSPKNEAEPEAAVALRLVEPAGIEVLTEIGARNSAETAIAARAIADRRGGDRVLLVTSGNHVARMAASLRHAGLGVVAHAVTGAWDGPVIAIPGADAFARSRAALREYVGILWYLINGSIVLEDLRSRRLEPAALALK